MIFVYLVISNNIHIQNYSRYVVVDLLYSLRRQFFNYLSADGVISANRAFHASQRRDQSSVGDHEAIWNQSDDAQSGPREQS